MRLLSLRLSFVAGLPTWSKVVFAIPMDKREILVELRRRYYGRVYFDSCYSSHFLDCWSPPARYPSNGTWLLGWGWAAWSNRLPLCCERLAPNARS